MNIGNKFSIFMTCLMLLALTVTSGCIKKRADKNAQGSGLEDGTVVPMSQVLNVVEEFEAGERLDSATQKEYTITVEDSAKDIFDD